MFDKQCQICGKANDGAIFKTDSSVSSDGVFQPYSINLATCDLCGNTYIIQDVTMHENLRKFYQQEYAFLLGSEEEEPCEITDQAALPYSDSIVSFFAPFIDQKIHKNILDIGAGKGNFLTALHRNFPKIEKHAIEPSSSFERLSKASFLKSCQNAFFDSSLYKEQFDLISIIGVLEHVLAPVAFLQDIKKVLRSPNPLVLVEVPNFTNNKSDLVTFDHLFKYTESSFENIVRLCGFSIVARRVDPKRVPMQFIIKSDTARPIATCSGVKPFLEAHVYIKFAISEAKKISSQQVAVYGQGLLLPYFLGTGVLEHENVHYIIDDNPLYQGSLYQGKIPIVSLDEFTDNQHHGVEAIFLAMNDCYHEAVLSKLQSKNLGIPIVGKQGRR